jgi:hypothetical protein
LLQQTTHYGDGSGGVEHKAVFHASLMALFKDHTIQGRTLFPGAGFVEMALAAVMSNTTRRGGDGGDMRVELRGVTFLEPLGLEEGTVVVCEVDGGGGMQLGLRGAAGDSGVSCEVAESLVQTSAFVAGKVKDELSKTKARCLEEEMGLEKRYKELAGLGFHGPQFQTLAQVWRGKDEFVARLRLPAREECRRYHVHPAVLDGVFQLASFIGGSSTKAWVPAAISSLTFRQAPRRSSDDVRTKEADSMWASTRVMEVNDRFRVLDLSVYDSATGAVLMSVEGFRFMALKPQPPASGLYEVRWLEAQAPMQDGPAPDDVGRVALLELPGCESLSSDVVTTLVERLPLAPSAGTLMAVEQRWPEADTLVVPVLRAREGAAMMAQLVRVLQVLPPLRVVWCGVVWCGVVLVWCWCCVGLVCCTVMWSYHVVWCANKVWCGRLILCDVV